MSDARFVNWSQVMKGGRRWAHCASAEGRYSAPAWDAQARSAAGTVDVADALVIDYCVRAVSTVDREVLRRWYIERQHPAVIMRALAIAASIRTWPQRVERARENALAFERFARIRHSAART